jgi:hypothetical protein
MKTCYANYIVLLWEGSSSIFFPVHKGLALDFGISMNAGIDACFLSTFLEQLQEPL